MLSSGWVVIGEILSDQDDEKNIRKQKQKKKTQVCVNRSVLTLQRIIRGFLDRKRVLKNYPKQLTKLITIRELIETENTYTSQLKLLIKGFKRPLEKNKIISQQVLQTIFSNSDLLLQLNSKFYQRLVEQQRDLNNYNWGHVFDGIVDFMKLYTIYVNNYQSAINAVSEQIATNKGFRNYLEKKTYDPKCHKLRIFSLLITPIQRIPRYVLLLKKIVKNTDRSHPDFINFQNILEKMKEVAELINQNRSNLLEFQRILTLQNKFINLDKGGLFVDVGRKLKKEGEIIIYLKDQKTKYSNQQSHHKQWCFLFNDIFLIAEKINENTFSKKFVINLNNLQLKSLPKSLGKYSTNFEFIIGGNVFILNCNNYENTLNWYNGLKTTIEKNIEKKRTFLDFYFWTKLPVNQGQLPPPVRYVKGGVYRRKLFIWGGEIAILNNQRRYLEDLYSLDLDSWTWRMIETEGQNPFGRIGHTLSLVNKRLYLFGGVRDGIVYGDLRYLDLETFVWYNIHLQNKSIPSPRYGHSATLIKNKIWIFGGIDENGKCLNDLYSFDLETNICSQMEYHEQTLQPRCWHSALYIKEKEELMIINGINEQAILNNVYCFNLITKIWRSESNFSSSHNQKRYNHSTIYYHDKLYLIGGTSNEQNLQDISVLNLKNSKWEEVINGGNQPISIENCLSVLLDYCNGKVLLFGGKIENHYSNSCYILEINFRRGKFSDQRKKSTIKIPILRSNSISQYTKSQINDQNDKNNFLYNTQNNLSFKNGDCNQRRFSAYGNIHINALDRGYGNANDHIFMNGYDHDHSYLSSHSYPQSHIKRRLKYIKLALNLRKNSKKNKRKNRLEIIPKSITIDQKLHNGIINNNAKAGLSLFHHKNNENNNRKRYNKNRIRTCSSSINNNNNFNRVAGKNIHNNNNNSNIFLNKKLLKKYYQNINNQLNEFSIDPNDFEIDFDPFKSQEESDEILKNEEKIHHINNNLKMVPEISGYKGIKGNPFSPIRSEKNKKRIKNNDNEDKQRGVKKREGRESNNDRSRQFIIKQNLKRKSNIFINKKSFSLINFYNQKNKNFSDQKFLYPIPHDFKKPIKNNENEIIKLKYNDNNNKKRNDLHGEIQMVKNKRITNHNNFNYRQYNLFENNKKVSSCANEVGDKKIIHKYSNVNRRSKSYHHKKNVKKRANLNCYKHNDDNQYFKSLLDRKRKKRRKGRSKNRKIKKHKNDYFSISSSPGNIINMKTKRNSLQCRNFSLNDKMFLELITHNETDLWNVNKNITLNKLLNILSKKYNHQLILKKSINGPGIHTQQEFEFLINDYFLKKIEKISLFVCFKRKKKQIKNK
ncbi:faciogenital dysplasia protein [Anaeramoeba flamelloides]|uniref:Faciogenital dysplasia protein n=1 Tax=Anaeramoeba flamelloides TaxID=1746091 RepID=A0ABQ8YLF3_9EUKA|nr:faciogenital dysplasia protein [Anaeramoeba flamelloides]